MKRTCKIAARALLAIAAVAVAVLLVEVFARVSGFYVPEDLHRIRAEERLHFVRDPDVGWRCRPLASYTVRGTTYDTPVTVNSSGFRDREFVVDRTPGVTRIAVLGDSFIWGYGSDAEHRFTNVLENELNAAGHRVEVYNFGIAGWGTDQQIVAYRKFVSRYRPNLVIDAYYVNDLFDNIMTEGKPHYILRDGRLELRNDPVPPPAEQEGASPGLLARSKQFLRERSFAYNALRNGFKQSPFLFGLGIRLGLITDETGEHDRASMQALTRALLEELREAVRAEGAAFMILWIPDLYELRGSRIDRDMRTGITVKNHFIRDGLNCPALDLVPVFTKSMKESDRPLYDEYDGRHWNDEGNRLVAMAVAEFLEAEGLPPYP